MPRSFKDAMIDRLLQLFLIAETSKRGEIMGKVKLLKMAYLAEDKMVKDRLKGFNYNFYRWDYGPMSNEALEDHEWLVNNGLVSDFPATPTKRGSEVLKELSELFDRNRHILDHINRIVNEFARVSGRDLRYDVYARPAPGKKIRVGDIQKGETLLSALLEKEAKETFRIDAEWLETISILMDKEFYESLQEGVKDVREGRVKRYESLQKNV